MYLDQEETHALWICTEQAHRIPRIPSLLGWSESHPQYPNWKFVVWGCPGVSSSHPFPGAVRIHLRDQGGGRWHQDGLRDNHEVAMRLWAKSSNLPKSSNIFRGDIPKIHEYSRNGKAMVKKNRSRETSFGFMIRVLTVKYQSSGRQPTFVQQLVLQHLFSHLHFPGGSWVCLGHFHLHMRRPAQVRFKLWFPSVHDGHS